MAMGQFCQGRGLMKLNLKNIDKKWKEYALAGCVCVLFFAIITNLGGIFSVIGRFIGILKPVIIGFAIAYIVNPLAMFFEKSLFKFIKKDKIKWAFSVFLTILIVLAIIVVLIASLIPEIADNIASLANNYQDYIDRFVGFLEGRKGLLGSQLVVGKLKEFVYADGGLFSRIGDLLQENAAVIVEKTTSIGSAAVSSLIGGIFAIYFLLAKNGIKRSFAKLFALMLSPLKYERLTIIATKFNTIFSKYIACDLIDAIAVFAVNYIFMLILGMPDALFISVVVGLTNLVPTFGPVIGLVIGVFILLLLSPSSVIIFIIWTIVLQTVDGYIFKPRMFGEVLNVPGVLILIFIIIFGAYMGVLGMLLAIPLAAIAMYIYSEVFIPWLELRKDLKAYHKEQGQEK